MGNYYNYSLWEFCTAQEFLRNLRVAGKLGFYRNDFESLMGSFLRQDDKFAGKFCG